MEELTQALQVINEYIKTLEDGQTLNIGLTDRGQGQLITLSQDSHLDYCEVSSIITQKVTL